MRTQLVLIVPLLAAMVTVLAVVGLNSVNAHIMSTPETNMTSMTNATMGGNMTGSENMTNSSSPMMPNSTSETNSKPPLHRFLNLFFLLLIISHISFNIDFCGCL